MRAHVRAADRTVRVVGAAPVRSARRSPVSLMLPAALLSALLPAAGAGDFVPAEIAAADAPPIAALGTFCVVSLADRQFEQASPHLCAVHEGRTYFFSSEEAHAAFLDAPERYAPAWCGIDPVAYLDADVLAEGVVLRRHAGRFYLFTDAKNWRTFRAAPGRYAR
jgi:YHS domain-containing protein